MSLDLQKNTPQNISKTILYKGLFTIKIYQAWTPGAGRQMKILMHDNTVLQRFGKLFNYRLIHNK